MKIKKTYWFANNWLWILVSEENQDYWLRFDQIKELITINNRLKELDDKTIENLEKLNIKIIKPPHQGELVAQYLRGEKWKQYIAQCPSCYLDPITVKHIVNHSNTL